MARSLDELGGDWHEGCSHSHLPPGAFGSVSYLATAHHNAAKGRS